MVDVPLQADFRRFRGTAGYLTGEIEHFDPETLQRLLRERLREQAERHDGGNRWIGTGGTSPFGHSGCPREGIRVGGSGVHRSA